MPLKINYRVAYTVLSGLIIILGALVAIRYARGNFRITQKGFYPQTGLLSANSFPSGAEVWVNDRLVTATDDTLYLEPGDYAVKIVKDGFSPWQKNLTISRELVTQTNAVLFPAAPSLVPLTFTGAEKLTPSPDGQKILFYTSSASAKTKNGLYILDLSNNVLALNRQPTQIAVDSSQSFDFGISNYIWSPDSSQILAINPQRTVLIEANKKTDVSTASDVSFRQKQILSEWEEEMYRREREYLARFPKEVIAMATASAKNVYISPDKKRILYTATQNLTLPTDLVPPVPATNNQPESRALQPGVTYIYDREEDKNFVVGQEKTTATKKLLAHDLWSNQLITLAASPSAFQQLQASTSAQTANNFAHYHTPTAEEFQWFTDSKHILYLSEGHIKLKEYDNTNDTTVFAGSVLDDFIYPWPDGSKLVILTSFSPDAPPNVYAIEIK